MKKIFLYFTVLVVAVLFSFPTASFAYTTSHQEARALSPKFAVFSIDYVFSNLTHDLYLPAIAKRENGALGSSFEVGYDFYQDQTDLELNGVAKAVIVSKAPVVNGMYKIAKGTSEKMTLIVLLGTSDTDYEADYALHVTSLPFLMDATKQQLNPSELGYYKTNEVELNSGHFKKRTMSEVSQ